MKPTAEKLDSFANNLKDLPPDEAKKLEKDFFQELAKAGISVKETNGMCMIKVKSDQLEAFEEIVEKYENCSNLNRGKRSLVEKGKAIQQKLEQSQSSEKQNNTEGRKAENAEVGELF